MRRPRREFDRAEQGAIARIDEIGRGGAALGSTWTTSRSPSGVMETTRAPEGRAMRSAKAAAPEAGGRAALGVDMRRAISAATTMKPITISTPITITSTFSQSGV